MRPQRGLVERQICNERRARLDRSYWPCVRAAIPPPSNHHCVCVSIWPVLGLPSSFLLERFRIYSPILFHMYGILPSRVASSSANSLFAQDAERCFRPFTCTCGVFEFLGKQSIIQVVISCMSLDCCVCLCSTPALHLFVSKGLQAPSASPWQIGHLLNPTRSLRQSTVRWLAELGYQKCIVDLIAGEAFWRRASEELGV